MRSGGLMFSALDCRMSGPGCNPGRPHCVLFFGKTLAIARLKQTSLEQSALMNEPTHVLSRKQNSPRFFIHFL